MSETKRAAQPSRGKSSRETGTAAGAGRLRILIGAALAVTVLIVYAPVAGSAFINYDDDLYVTQNPMVQRGLTAQGFVWAFTTVKLYYWQPLTWLSHMLDCQLFGLDPGPQHMVNVGFHIANAVFLFLLLDRLTRRIWPSALTAGMFALHPLRVESVAWIAERKDVLSGFFFMVTLWAYWRFTRNPSWQRYVLVGAAFALALMSKPTVVTVPFLLLLLDYWPLNRLPLNRAALRPRVIEKIPLLAMSAGASAVTYLGQKQFHAVTRLPWSSHLGNAATAYVRYLALTFCPRNLAILYPYRMSFPAWQVAASLLLLGVITWFAAAFAPRRPYLPTGWFWFAGGLVPVIGIVQAGPQALADRFTYLPSIGLLMILAWAWCDWASGSERRRVWSTGLAALLLTLLAGLSAAQVRTWKDGVTVFSRASEVAPDDAVIQHDLGYALAAAGQPAAAIPHYQEALRLYPDNFRAHYNLGRALVDTGNPAEAIPHFAQVLRLDPGSDFAADAHNALAIVLVRRGRMGEAEPHFREAVRLKPNSPELHNNLGSLLAQKHDLQNAAAEFAAAVRLNPSYAEAHKNRAYALLQLGRRKEALAEFSRALELSPGDPNIQRQIGLLQQP